MIIRTKGDTTTALINDENADELSSEGTNYETKSLISLIANAVGEKHDAFSIHPAKAN